VHVVALLAAREGVREQYVGGVRCTGAGRLPLGWLTWMGWRLRVYKVP
jgi:hypothetical protein